MKLNYTKRGNSHTLFKHSRTGALPFRSFTIARSTEEYKETSGPSEGLKFAGIEERRYAPNFFKMNQR